MCGIFGWVSPKKTNLIDRETGIKLTDQLVHRGPDSANYYNDNMIFLGHRRLKIIDLSDNANQPMHDASGRYTIVFNGEIYNYIELKQELANEGVTFVTKSDTEVLLSAYIHWGMDFLQKIEGMFAFAIYDKKEKSVLLCRDHLGQKPLYYTHQNDQFVFSSELRSIINHPHTSNELDFEAILKYHAHDIFPYNLTPIQQVKKLLPGHYLMYKNDKVELKQYWDSRPGLDSQKIDLDDMLENLDSLFTSSLKKHLRSDVPFGVFLSGGVDSSLVTYYAKKVLQEKDLHTFSVGINFSNFDESHVAQSVSDKVGTKSTILSLNQEELIKSLDIMLKHTDEPLADPGLINSHFISHKARKHIKVALAGDGGDELFGGYITFKAASLFNKMSFLPKRFFVPFMALARIIFSNKNSYMNTYFKLKQFTKGFAEDNSTRLPAWLSGAVHGEIRNIYAEDFLGSKLDQSRINNQFLFNDSHMLSSKLESKSLEDIMLYQYQKYFLPEFVLAHTDRASMACSLEVRCPIVDKNIIEFANRLPRNMKTKNGKLKKALFDLVHKLDFPPVVTQHKKQGFTFPVALWLKGMLKKNLDEIQSYIDGPGSEVFNKTFINKLIDEHLNDRDNHYRILWNLIILIQWRKNFPQCHF